jgi:hypothetical protein
MNADEASASLSSFNGCGNCELVSHPHFSSLVDRTELLANFCGLFITRP